MIMPGLELLFEGDKNRSPRPSTSVRARRTADVAEAVDVVALDDLFLR
jgi:hypothetical protein